MKMVFQSVLCLGLAISELVWLLSQARRELANNPPDIIPHMTSEQEVVYKHSWRLWCYQNWNVQQTTHADEVFWVLFCTLIMTWKTS